MLTIINEDNFNKIHYAYPLIIFLMGPTASGKTSLAINLKKRKLNVQIISVDSALVYKGMNIGTAKPSPAELQYAPHRLIDIKNPDENYSVAEFYYDVILEINNIIRSGCIPLLVGGTMLYFKVLLHGLFDLPKTNQKIRDNLQQEARQKGWINMYNKLKCVDPISSSEIHWNDHKRIIRALEVFLISGTPYSVFKKKWNQLLPYQVLQFAIMPSNYQILYDRIERRFYQMLQIGFEKEVNTLFNQFNLYKTPATSAMLCIGYRQMWEYLLGKIKYEEMILDSISATRKLVKKQLTWLRKWTNLFWLNGDCTSIATDAVLQVLSKINFPSNINLFKN